MHFTDLIIVNSFNITSRGLVLVSNLEFSGNTLENTLVSIDDTLEYNSKIYKINGCSGIRSTDVNDNVVGLMVEEIK